MTVWSKEEDAILIKAIKDGLTAGQCANKLGRSRNACVGRAHRAGWRFGVGRVAGLAEAVKERTRLRKREKRRDPDARPAGDWDHKLFEPYAHRKARLAKERGSRA